MIATSLRSRCLALCSCSFGFSILSTTFSFYYVKVFLNLYKMEESWFQTAQILYLVWNAVNDPLFAYCQDTSRSKLTRTRREMILYTGPLFGLAYLIAWFPWATSGWLTGIHLIVSLCLYDTMYTFIGLALCCLFTEITVTESDRIFLTRMQQGASFFASFAVTICEYSSQSLTIYFNFQVMTVCIAITSAFFLCLGGRYAHTIYDLKTLEKGDDDELLSLQGNQSKSDDTISYWTYTWQILSNRNFLSFVICNFFQEVHRAFLTSFTVIVCDQLVSQHDLPPLVRSLFYGSLTAVHSLIIIFGGSVIHYMGYYAVIKGNFFWKILLGIVMGLIGEGHPWLLVLFIFVDSAYMLTASSLFNLPLADVVDSDMKLYNRRHPITSLIFGTNALVVKPAQSVCPMIVVYILNLYGYASLKKGTLTDSQVAHLNTAMFTIVWCLPIMMGIVQSYCWSYFTFRRRQDISITTAI